jgi:hypothetical protein
VHSLQYAHYIRTLRPIDDPDATVEFVCISRDANIIVYTEVIVSYLLRLIVFFLLIRWLMLFYFIFQGEYYLHTYSVNGKLLNSIEIPDQLNHMISASDKNIILTANNKGQIYVYYALRFV